MSPGQTIAYISDVAADVLKPLFVAGCAVTAVGFVLGLGVERWARHEGRCVLLLFYFILYDADTNVNATSDSSQTPAPPKKCSAHSPSLSAF